MDVKRVLLVDDEADIRTVARLSLEHVGGLEVRLAECGTECLRLAAVDRPDLILLDMMMPGKDGIQTLHELQANPLTAGIPVIFMTARIQPKEVESYLAEGAIGVIKKPFDPMELPGELAGIAATCG